jgi:DNA repair protein RadC
MLQVFTIAFHNPREISASVEDRELTLRHVRAGQITEIELLDHDLASGRYWASRRRDVSPQTQRIE